MPDHLLTSGVVGLARTSSIFPDLWFHGHHGAGVLAAYFMCAELDLGKSVAAAVCDFAEDIIRRTPELFTEDSHQDSRPADFGLVASTLEQHIKCLTADGHDVIFASLALKAFHLNPELATAARVRGIVELIQHAQTDNPKRYYGYHNYLEDPVDYSEIPRFENLGQAVAYALADHQTVYPDQVIDGQHYFLAGNKLHDITHAQALVDLEQMGYSRLANRGIDALRKQLHLCNTQRLPDTLTPFASTDTLNPLHLSFWQRDKIDAHQVKLAYAILSLQRYLPTHNWPATLKDVSAYWALLN